jgi:hypothetical protein
MPLSLSVFLFIKLKKPTEYHTMGTIPKSNRKVVEREAKIVTPGFTHKYMTAHFPGLVQALQ